MALHTFPSQLVVDKATGRGVAGAVGTVTDRFTGAPVDVLDSQGNPKRLLTNHDGYFEEFQSSDQHDVIVMTFGRVSLTGVALEIMQKASEAPAQLSALTAQYLQDVANQNTKITNLDARVEGVEALAGLSPSSPVDGQTANLIEQPGTLTNAALSAAIDSTPGLTVAQNVARKLRGKKVAVVFRHDDVQSSALAYLPLYDQHKVQATWYVAYNQMRGLPGQLSQNASPAEIQDLHARGHEIGSHTMDHFYMGTSTEEERRTQMQDSKKALENLIGGGYVCETFAYPGNQSLNRYECLDYYLLGTSSVPTQADSGATNTAGTIDVSAHQAEYPSILIDPNPALTPAKAQAWFNAQKARPGTTIITLQAHNQLEMSVANLSALLDVIAADPEVTTLTLREVAHYIRTYNTTSDGRNYYSTQSAGQEIRFNSTLVGANGLTVDRVGNGNSLAIKVNGVIVATLDEGLSFKKASAVTRLENGHRLFIYESGNASSSTIEQIAGDVLNLSNSGGTVRVNSTLDVLGTGAAFKVRSGAQGETFSVDATRQTLKLKNLTALPTGTASVGEMCLVGTKLYVCNTAGNPGMWVVVGEQTA